MNTVEIIDRIKQAQGVVSDYAVAKLLGVRPSTVVHYRSGDRTMSDDVLPRAAQLADVPLSAAAAAVAAERTRNPLVRKALETVAKGLLACVPVVISLQIPALIAHCILCKTPRGAVFSVSRSRAGRRCRLQSRSHGVAA